MKKRLSIVTVLTVLANACLLAQNVTGKIIDERLTPIPYVSCVLQDASDSSYVSGTVSATDGHFRIPAQDGREFILQLSYMGYEDVRKICKAGDLGTIVLKEDSKALNEVTITGHRIVHKANGYTINLKNDKMVKGKQTPNLLAFLPGITVEDDAIKILSQSPHAIYLDGVKILDFKELESIPASQLTSVEVDYMAGVEENANARGGIIRITSKKERNGGYSGYLRGNTGTFLDYGYRGEGLGGNFKARYGKLSIYNTLSYDRRLLLEDAHENHYFKNTNTEIFSNTEMRNWYHMLYDRFGMTYDMTDNQSIGFSALFYTDKDNAETKTIYNKDDMTYKAHLLTPANNDKYQAVLNYQWEVDDKGSQLSFTADYLRNDVEINQVQTTTENVHEQSRAFQYTDMLRVKPMFATPLGKGSASFGGDMQYIHYTDILSNSMQTNRATANMKGFQPALFADYSGVYKGLFMYEVGLRFQGNVMDVNSGSIQNYHEDWGLCPMTSLLFLINPEKGHMINLEYKRTMGALPYSVISTYKQYSSPQSYVIGNPNLKAPTTDEVMAVAALYDKLTFMAGCIHTANQIYYSTEVDAKDPTIGYTTPKNGTSQTVVLLGAEGRINPTKWWQTKANANLLLNSAKTESFNVINQAHWTFGLNNNFTFTKTFGGELKFQYEPDCHYLDVLMKSIYSISGSIYKSFLSEQLECKADFTLYRKGRTSITSTPEYALIYLNETRSQYLSLSATWYFNGGKKVKVKQNAKSIQEYKEYVNDKK